MNQKGYSAEPRQASIFHRDRTPVVEVKGRERLAGNQNLELPMSCHILGIDFQSAITSQLGGATLRLEAAPNAEPFLRIHLFARNVTDVRVPPLSQQGAACELFDIVDLRESERPGVNWQVGETSLTCPPELTFKFFAEEVEITSVTFEA